MDTLQGVPSANQFTVTANPANTTLPANPFVHVSQVDVGLYVEDDWRIRPNITLSYGLRFESQNNISNHADWAPRLGFAWGIGGGGKSAPKTMLRAGFGVFYDRFTIALRAGRGPPERHVAGRIRGAQPDFFNPNPAPPPLLTPSPTQLLTSYQTNQNLHAPYVAQTAVSLERQLTKIANLNVSYLNSIGNDQLLTNNINAPNNLAVNLSLLLESGCRDPPTPVTKISISTSRGRFSGRINCSCRAGCRRGRS